MAGREKRKRRRRERQPREPARVGTPATTSAARPSKDDLARERLEPLEPGERPRAVTVAAIVAAVLALSNLAGWVAGVEINDRSFSAGEVLPQATLMLVAAAGMWRARYWAVLGFQAILAILIILMSLLLFTAENLLAVVVSVAILAAAGTLFWFLVKSLARIQMPERRPPA